MTWAVITGEYPPQPGGVADYTRLVARGLAKEGAEVHVWAPATDGEPCDDPGVSVHRLPGHFGPEALRRLDTDLNRLPSLRRILVQYVPHAFGSKAMNVPFCLWLESRRRDSIWSMFHEVAFPRGRNQPLRHQVLGAITGYMAKLAARASERIFFSTTAWLPLLDGFAPATQKTWLPVPSNVAETADPEAVAAIQARISKSVGPNVIGHFGTYAPQYQEFLMDLFARVLQPPGAGVGLFAGRGSTQFRSRFAGRMPALADRVHAIETDCADTLAAHLAACDVLVQPYPDGVTTRRASLMASLALGKAIVTTRGRLTESLWEESGAVALTPAMESEAMASTAMELAKSTSRRTDLGFRAAALYANRFALRHTVRELLSQA
ncbi:MAG TPA: glycosyltransferase family 4 protein [Bryobacteraceae bacterium]|jgi:glycosyltransferase involved in cell wall biosynthesis